MGCNASTPGEILYPNSDFGNKNPNTAGQEVLERYIELENEIAEVEKHSPLAVLSNKREQIAALEKRIVEQEDKVSQLEQQTQKEKRDLDILDQTFSTKELFEKGGLEAKRQKELQEYLDAKNKEEIAKKEAENLREQVKNIKNEISELEQQSDRLQRLYDEQSDLLIQIFGGSYGSANENRLEAELDHNEELRNRIVEANFKWRQAQLMIDYAYKQLNFAVKKWEEIPFIPVNELESRYMVACETRNNLVAASQNIQGAHGYLSNVRFPYCDPSEVATLNKATAYIFTDMQTPDRHEHALECYTVTAKRCGALLQWINQVVTQTIQRDLIDINAKVKQVSMDLRQERINLIKVKVKEVLGRDIDIKLQDLDTDVGVDLNFNDVAKTDGIDPNILEQLSDSELAALVSASDDDLAPPPSKVEVFGEKLEELSKEFLEDQSRVEKQFAENQNRVVNSLEKKLAARRVRRARKFIESKESEAYKKQHS